MAATEVLARADRAFVEEDFDEALKLYTQASELEPSNAAIWEARAHAHIKLEQYLEAAADALKAIELDPGLAKAYLRKGVASFHLEEYESAKESFEAGARLAPENSQFKTWIRKCIAELEDEGTVQPPAAQSKSSAPALPTPAPAPVSQPQHPSSPPQQDASTQQRDQQQQQDQEQAPLAKAAPAPFAGKYRHSWYQLQNKVTVDVYAKGLNKEQVSVSFQPQHLSVVITEAGSSEEYRLDTELYGKVQPESCRYEVLRTKVEITMTKADSTQWATLEKSAKVAAANYSNTSAPPVAGQYPSSYVKKPTDWNKIESDVKKQLESGGELEDGDPLNNFFKKIFSQGDEDQRRAMMKSFVESNGTVLSTNWSDVGAKKVECTPPDGMEVRKWGA